MTMPAANEEVVNPEDVLEVVETSSESNGFEESKEEEKEGDEWNIELFERPAKRQKVEICDVKLLPDPPLHE